MRKRRNKRIWLWLLLLLVACAAALTGYFIWMDRGREEKKLIVIKEAPKSEKDVPKEEIQIQEKEEPPIREDIGEPKLPDQKDYCSRIESEVREFFRYLDNKSYIQHIEAGMDTYDRFKKLIKKLSSQPPIPAGEGIDYKIITRNIFLFSRLLDKKDLRLIKEIMRNEADTLEINLDIFYKWIMLENRCPDQNGIRPSMDVLYQYAGFLLNTIGGRAYIFRRPLGIRLLVSYYCLLIIHEADKRGKNSYGIDIFPEIELLAKEISLYPDFHFQNDYILELTKLQNYYLKKR